MQHVEDGAARHVGGGDDVVLLVADAGRDGFRGGLGDGLRAADQVFGGHGLAAVAGVEDLKMGR